MKTASLYVSNSSGRLIQLKEKVFRFIKQFIAKNRYAPTVKEIRDGTGIKSTSTAFDYLQILQRGGYIKYQTGKSRTIVILKELEVK